MEIAARQGYQALQAPTAPREAVARMASAFCGGDLGANRAGRDHLALQALPALQVQRAVAEQTASASYGAAPEANRGGRALLATEELPARKARQERHPLRPAFRGTVRRISVLAYCLRSITRPP